MSCHSAPLSRRVFSRLFSAIALSIVVFGLATSASAQRIGWPLSPDDPENLWPGGGDAPLPIRAYTRLLPTAESFLPPQRYQPGYIWPDSAYRQIYNGTTYPGTAYPGINYGGASYSGAVYSGTTYVGAVQPTGHEIQMTHGGNGYTYQPTYGYAGGYGGYGNYGYADPNMYTARTVGSSGRAYVANYPGTPFASYYGSSHGRAAVVDVPQGYDVGAYANYVSSDIGYGTQVTYAEAPATNAAPTAPSAPQQGQPTLAPAPRPKNLEDLPNPQSPKKEF